MSGENIKKVYVINLDNRRVILLSGLFFLLFGMSFLAGLKWNTGEVHNIVNTVESPVAPSDLDQTEILSSKTPGKETNVAENNVLALPEEDTRMFDRQGKVENDDPFLSEPPGQSTVKKTGAQTRDKKTAGVVAEKKTASAVSEKYYTIQIAAFAHEKDAIAYQGLLKKKDINARVDHGKTHYFVRTGKASDKVSLQPMLKKINTTLKLQAIVVQKKTP